MDPNTVELINAKVNAVVQNSQDSMLNQLDTLISSKLATFEGQFLRNHKNMSDAQFSKLQHDILAGDSHKFTKKSCEDQYKFNQKVYSKLKDAELAIDSSDISETRDKISEGIDLINYRQKLVKLADSSEAGWKAVEEYVANPIASDSDDEKRMERARNRANRKVKALKLKKDRSTRRFQPYPASVASSSQADTQKNPRILKPGTCYGCGAPGHWRRECTNVQSGTAGSSGTMGNKISTNYMFVKNESERNVEFVSGNINSEISNFDLCNDESKVKSPVGRLKACFLKWKAANANDYVLDVISNGYKLPFKVLPVLCELRNNRSSIDNPSFVSKEILKLLSLGCVSEVPVAPKVVNPLTVAYAKSGKARLVLDCRHLNKCLHKFKFKYENSEVARDILSTGDFVFTFDLKSAYHHVEIFPDHTEYLGFAWCFNGKKRYFGFVVLPFGISTAAYVFTKVLREVVKYFRSNSIRLVMFFDDGICGEKSKDEASRISTFVRRNIIEFSFLIAHEKCDWHPKTVCTWLGYTWFMKEGVVRVTNDRLHRLVRCLTQTLLYVDQGKYLFKVRWLAALVGQIISMQSVFGYAVRLRTRHLYNCILTRASWNARVLLSSSAISELKYWLENVEEFNVKGSPLKKFSGISNVIVCSDASNIGFGGYVTPCEGSFHEGENENSELLNERYTDMEVDEILGSSRNHCVLGSWDETEQVGERLRLQKGCYFRP